MTGEGESELVYWGARVRFVSPSEIKMLPLSIVNSKIVSQRRPPLSSVGLSPKQTRSKIKMYKENGFPLKKFYCKQKRIERNNPASGTLCRSLVEKY